MKIRNRKWKRLALGTALSIMGAYAGTANAALITSAAPLGPATVIDFSQFDIGNYTFTNGPTQIGGLVGDNVVWTAVAPSPGFGGGSYGLLSNGSWSDPVGPGGRNGYSFLNNGGSYMDYTFNSGLVSGVGGFMNYCPECPPAPAMIEALGVGNVVLETWDIEALAPISTPGGVDAGAFRGILRAQADIKTFRVYNRIAVLDDLTYSLSPIPEPGTLALMGLGLAGIGWRRKVSS